MPHTRCFLLCSSTHVETVGENGYNYWIPAHSQLEKPPRRSPMPIPLPPTFRRRREKVDSVEQLRARLVPLLKRLKIVSFDVFDTVLPSDIEPQSHRKAISARESPGSSR